MAKKLTKKEYSRKRLMTAVAIFVAVVLIVTGISIWLLFTALNGTLGANLTVGSVIDSPLAFSRIAIDGLEIELNSRERKVDTGFRFDSARDDLDGRLMWNGTDCEKMTVDVDIVIDHAQYLQQFEYELAFPSGVIEAAEKGYLDLGNYYDWEQEKPTRIEIPIDNGTYIAEQDAWRLRFSLTLTWGSVFGGVNPSIYYDDEGSDISYEEMRNTLNDFYNMVMSGSLFSTPTFTLTVIASPKL